MDFVFDSRRRAKEANKNEDRRVGHCDASPKNVGRYPPKIHGHFKVTDTSNASQSTHHVNEKRTNSESRFCDLRGCPMRSNRRRTRRSRSDRTTPQNSHTHVRR